MCIYAKQVNPEFQESPLFDIGEWPEGIMVTGNRDFYSRTTSDYEDIMRYFDEMANDFEDSCYYWTTENGKIIKKSKKPDCSIAEILRSYGFKRNDGKSWTNQQKHKWKIIMEDDRGVESEEIVCAALQLITGYKWGYQQISGCSQGDWNYIYYREDLWDDQQIKNFETMYFNTGSEWVIHDGDEVPENPEDIYGVNMYCCGWNSDAIKKEIAAAEGENPENVILFAFAGYQKIPTYNRV